MKRAKYNSRLPKRVHTRQCTRVKMRKKGSHKDRARGVAPRTPTFLSNPKNIADYPFSFLPPSSFPHRASTYPAMGRATGGQLIMEGLQWWYLQVTSFLASYGWPLLLSFLVGWWLKTEKFDPWWEQKRQARLMKEAQRKERVEVLDEDKKRVREKQFKTLAGKIG